MPTATDRRLTPTQTRAAELIGGRGWRQNEVAHELDVAPKTIQRWMKLPAFEALVKQRREASLDESPSARDVLEAGLNATTHSGEPDWQTRLKSAELLIRSTPAEPGGPGADLRERIYVGEDD